MPGRVRRALRAPRSATCSSCRSSTSRAPRTTRPCSAWSPTTAPSTCTSTATATPGSPDERPRRDRWLVNAGSLALARRPRPARHERRAGRQEGDRKALLEDLGAELAGLQERLYAESTPGAARRPAGDGRRRQGRHHQARLPRREPAGRRGSPRSRQPTPEELAHDFLWRIHANVAAARLHRDLQPLALRGRARRAGPRASSRSRCGARATATSTTSRRSCHDAGHRASSSCSCTSRARSRPSGCARGSPTRRSGGSSTPRDLAERARWDDYQAAYEEAIRADLDRARAVVRVPADRKWFRNWAVSRIVIETLEDMDPRYPEPAGGPRRPSRSRERVGRAA